MSDVREKCVPCSDRGALDDSTGVLGNQELDRVSGGLPAVQRGREPVRSIRDGTSNTILFGEKHIR